MVHVIAVKPYGSISDPLFFLTNIKHLSKGQSTTYWLFFFIYLRSTTVKLPTGYFFSCRKRHPDTGVFMWFSAILRTRFLENTFGWLLLKRFISVTELIKDQIFPLKIGFSFHPNKQEQKQNFTRKKSKVCHHFPVFNKISALKQSIINVAETSFQKIPQCCS